MNEINVNQAPFEFRGVSHKAIHNYSTNYKIIKNYTKPKLELTQSISKFPVED